jgi:transposase
MVTRPRRFSREFKLQVIRELDLGKSLAQAGREHRIHPNVIFKWRKELEQYGGKAFAGQGKTYKTEARVAELERMVGQLAMENAFLKKLLGQLNVTKKEEREN